VVDVGTVLAGGGNMLKMFVDSREPLDIRKLAIKRGFKQMALTVGDFASPMCVFERKDVGDLVNSIFARRGETPRLFKQLNRMYAQCSAYKRIGFLLVTGKIVTVEEQFAKRKQTLNRNSIYGAIGATVVRYDMNLIWTEQPAEEWLEEIIKVAEKVEEGKLLMPKRKKLKEYSRVRSVAVVARALDISPKLAIRLVKKFGGLFGVLHAIKYNPSQVLVMEGIGEKTFMKMKGLANI